MRILNSIFVLISAFLISTISAEELIRFDREVAGFVNYASQGSNKSMLFITEQGKGYWVQDALITKILPYKNVDYQCVTHHQNTTSIGMEEVTGMTLAYPYLVGVGWVCKIDDESKSINFVGYFPLPVNPFAIVYAGEDLKNSYFLLNSKPMKGTGFLELISINKKDSKISSRNLLSNVPGYSGAMFSAPKDIWVSMWPGRIYKIQKSDILDLIQANKEQDFQKIATLEYKTSKDMNIDMYMNDNSFLYDNGENGAYTINRFDSSLTKVSLPCTPIAGHGVDWLVLCHKNSLQMWSSHSK